jgi:hypothetical protein
VFPLNFDTCEFRLAKYVLHLESCLFHQTLSKISNCVCINKNLHKYLMIKLNQIPFSLISRDYWPWGFLEQPFRQKTCGVHGFQVVPKLLENEYWMTTIFNFYFFIWSNIKTAEKSAVTVIFFGNFKISFSYFCFQDNFLKPILYHFSNYQYFKLVGWGCVIQTNQL